MHHCCHRGAIVTSSFVTSLDRLDLPIGPVDVVLPDVDGEHVVQMKVGVFVTTGYESDIVTIKVSGGDVVFSGIRPEYLSRFVGNGKCVGPTQVFVNDNTRVGTVHTRFTNVHPGTPVCPIHVTIDRIQRNSSGFFQIFGV